MDVYGDLAFKFFGSIGSDFLDRFGTWFFSDGYFRDKFFVFSTWVFHRKISFNTELSFNTVFAHTRVRAREGRGAGFLNLS
jgi:hypothetical protein